MPKTDQTQAQNVKRLLEIGRELAATASLNTLLNQVAAAAVELLNCETTAVFLWDEQREELRFVPTARTDQSPQDPAVPLKKSNVGKALSSGKPVVAAGTRKSPRRFKAIDQWLGIETRSLLAVPLRFKDRWVGALEVVNKPGEEPFSQEDAEILTMLAAQATIAIENTQTVARLQDAHDLAEALRHAGAAVSGTLDYKEVLDRILEQVVRLVPQAAANIMLVEGNIGRVFRGHGYEQFGDTIVDAAIEFDISNIAAFQEMLRTGRSIVIPDVEQYDEWVTVRPEHHWIKSYMGVPIRVRDQIIGFLNLNSATSGFFDQMIADRLQALADHVAIAIENARLYDQANQELAERVRVEEELREHQDRLEEMVAERTRELIHANEQLEQEIAEHTQAKAILQKRNQELTALNTVAEALSNSLELQDILGQALSRVIDALGFSGGWVCLAHQHTGTLAALSHMGVPQELLNYFRAHSLEGSLCERVAQEATPLCIGDLNNDTPFDAQVFLEAGVVSYTGIPIVYRDQVLGTLALFDRSPRAVSEDDLVLLTAIGRQMGAAVANAHLFRDVVRERQASYILLDIAEALSATLRVDVLLERVLDELQRVVSYDAASISMLRDDRCWMVASRGMEHVVTRPFPIKDRPLVQRVADSRSPVIVPVVQEEPDWIADGSVDLIQSWMGVPLISTDEVSGVLMMNSRQPYAYDEEAARLVMAFAHQASLAIENSRLYEHVQAQLRETNLLQSVTMALSSTLELDHILPYVARSLYEIMNSSGVEIYTLDQSSGQIKLAARHMESETETKPGGVELGQMFELEDLRWITELLAQRRPVQAQLNDPQSDLRLQVRLEERAAQAALWLPMIAADHALGFAQILEVQSPRHFSEGEIATGLTLAQQGAIAIYNARLVEALRQYTNELETQNAELDAFAHTVAHDLKTPLTSLIGFSDLIEMRVGDISREQLESSLRTIGKSGRKLVNIIDELLLLASVRKMGEVETARLDMASIMTEVQDRMADLITESKAELVLPESWPDAVGYAPWIEEVWVNYISNALKYGGQPPSAEMGGEKQADGAVRFWVRDNGLGLSAEEKSRLFTPFTRFHQVRIEGHGLGLSIVQRIVAKMGGQVGVHSRVGEGSEFFFTLPGVE